MAKKRTAEWWRKAKYWVMGEWLGDRLSKRKRILFGCATARLVWDDVTRPANRAAIETAERYADGLVSREVFASVWMALEWEPAMWGDWNIMALTDGLPYRQTTDEDQKYRLDNPYHSEVKVTERVWSDALRDIVGDPFAPVTIDQTWVACNDGIVGKLATAIYDEHRFVDLPIVADALEDAGCDCRELLDHLRAPGRHFRGCWALDLVLGKV